jgi:hypothetical protein
MQKNNLILFSGISVTLLLINFYSQTYLITDDFYRMVIGTQMTERQFEDYLSFLRKWQWIGYFVIPIALLFRIFFSWVCLKSGSILTESFEKVPFWNVCMQAEVLFLIGAVFTLLYTEFFVDVKNMEQLSTNPFSLLTIFSENVPKWSHYFFNTLNLFELGYVLFLAYMIASESKRTFTTSLKFVATTYLPGLALWIILVTYISVVFQP